MAKRFISKQRRLRRPFYLQVDHLAPHVGSRTEESRCSGAAVPAAENEQLFKDAEAPRTPAVTEADVSDKPEFIQRHGPLLAPDLARADHSYGCSLAALQTVDEGVAAIVSALRKARELKRTMVIFTSDNGYSYAEHRMPVSKGLPYEEHMRVPFVIRPPEGRGFTKRSLVGSSVAAPVSNVDLAPTILKLGKAEPCPLDGRDCRRLDGRSLVPLLRGKARQWTDTRAIRTGFNVNFGDYRRSCEWDGLRTPELMLVNHVELPEPGGTECRAADEYELYDLVNDPFQLEGDIPVPDSLRNRLNDLRRCSGIQGRDKPLKRPFCE